MRPLPMMMTLLVLAPVLAATPAGTPPARAIPGLTAPDAFPRGCVDCHAPIPEPPRDVRISTLMRSWTSGADPKLLAKARAAAPGLELSGKHPEVLKVGDSIPSSCLGCHQRDSRTAPPFASLLHAIHLEGGEENVFLTVFQGECTHCHKVDLRTGRPTVPSAPEPAP